MRRGKKPPDAYLSRSTSTVVSPNIAAAAVVVRVSPAFETGGEPTDEKRSTLKTVLIWIAAIVGVFVLLHTIFVGGTNRRLQAELERIKSRGEPISCAELGGPKIPDDLNAAVVYDQAFQMMGNKPTQDDARTVENFCATDYTTKDAKQWAEAKGAFSRIGGVIALLEEAADRPQCRFPVDWAAGAAALFPHYAHIRGSARIVGVGAVLKAREGDAAGAARLLELGFGLAESIKDEPMLISVLVHVAVIKIETAALQNVLRYTQFTEAQARGLFDMLGKIDLRRSYVKAMQGERAMGLWCFDTVKKSPAGQLGLGQGGFDPMNYLGSYAWRPLLNMDEGVYLTFMRQQIDQAAMTCLEMKKKGITPPSDANLPGYAHLSRMIAPVFSRAQLARDGTIAEIALGRVTLALQGYKSRFGSYPASLKELRLKLGWKLPEDPFRGSDLKYKRKHAGYVLYSIGGDMKDNGGSAQTASSSGGYNAGLPGDDVWTQER